MLVLTLVRLKFTQ